MMLDTERDPWPWDDILVGKVFITEDELQGLSIPTFRVMVFQAGERRPWVDKTSVRQGTYEGERGVWVLTRMRPGGGGSAAIPDRSEESDLVKSPGG